jgi:hypothetical protein
MSATRNLQSLKAPVATASGSVTFGTQTKLAFYPEDGLSVSPAEVETDTAGNLNVPSQLTTGCVVNSRFHTEPTRINYGFWSSSVNYPINAVVQSGPDLFISLIDNNINNSPNDPASTVWQISPGIGSPTQNGTYLTVVGPGWSLGNLGGWTVNSSTAQNFSVSQRGISQVNSFSLNKRAVGDTAGFYGYVNTDGGSTAQSDEGATAMTLQLTENYGYYHGNVVLTTGKGDVAPLFSDATSGNNWTTDGAFMLNVAAPVASGRCTGESTYWNNSFISQFPTDQTALPLSTKIAQVVGGTVFTLTAVGTSVGENAIYYYSGCNVANVDPSRLCGQPITVAGFTAGVNNGNFVIVAANYNQLQVNNASAVAESKPASAMSPCILWQNCSADNPISMTLIVNAVEIGGAFPALAVGDVVSVAGTNYPEQSVITAVSTVGTNQQAVTLKLRNPNSAAYLFCGGLQGTYISFPANLTFSGMRSSYYAYGSTDGINVIYGLNVTGITTGNTIPQVGNEAALADGSADSAFECFPGAEVVANTDTGHACVLEQNSVVWKVGDPVENPHYPVFGGNGVAFNKYQTTPTNQSASSSAFWAVVGGPGFGGFNAKAFNFINTNPTAYYQVSGGPLKEPQGITLAGIYADSLLIDHAPNHGAVMRITGGSNGPTDYSEQTFVNYNYAQGGAIKFSPTSTNSGPGTWHIPVLNTETLTVKGQALLNPNVNGYIKAGAVSLAVANGLVSGIASPTFPQPNADYNSLPTDSIIICNPSSNITVSLADNGNDAYQVVTIANKSGYTVTLACNSDWNTANGHVIPGRGCAQVLCLGGRFWIIVSAYNPAAI